MKIKFKLINDLSSIPDGGRFIPVLPAIKGLVPEFADNPYGTLLIEKGPHSDATFVYGQCDDDAVLPQGVEQITDQVYHDTLRYTRYNVPHETGWVFDENVMVWVPPLPYPDDGGNYEWDQNQMTWTEAK